MVTMISSNTIFISWSDLPCEFRHGLFLEVIILIADVETGGQVEHRVPGNLSSAVLTGLNPVTTYTIAVALSNSNGTGPYSAPISVTTLTLTSGVYTCYVVNKVSSTYYRNLGHHNSCILICSWFPDSVSLSHFISDTNTCMCYQMEVSQKW